jgi:ankyrin repeat protein
MTTTTTERAQRLIRACVAGDEIGVRAELAAAASPFELASPRPPLLYAAESGCLGAALALLEAGHDVNAKDAMGETALHCAGSAAIVRLLIQFGANKHARDRMGCTPLHAASSAEVTVALLDAGADPLDEDDNANVPLHRARDVGAARALVARGWAAVGRRNMCDETPLHTAASEDVATYLMFETGADARAKDRTGRAVLHTAVMAGFLEIVRVLSMVEDVGARDMFGHTPLHYALRADIAEELLDAGADPNDDGADHSPLHVMVEGGARADLVRLMIRRGAMVTPKLVEVAMRADVRALLMSMQ